MTEQLPRDEVLVGWSVLGGCNGTKGLPRVVTQSIYPGVENIHADGLSREGVTVEGSLLYAVDQRSGRHTRKRQTRCRQVRRAAGGPLRASRKRRVASLLRAGQGEVTVDAMSVLWSRVLRYAFPRGVLIPRVLDKIRSDETTVVLIARRWPDRRWLAKLLHCLVEAPMALPA